MEENKVQGTQADKLEKKETLRDKIGGAIEKAGKSISNAGAEKLGQAIYNAGDKMEKSHDSPDHPRQV